jgi:hypothetical protein
MALSASQSVKHLQFWSMLKSFSVWSFTLFIVYLMVGYPLFILTIIIGSLFAIALEPVLQTSAVLWVAGSLIGIHLLAMLGGALMLTLRGIHPHEVSWLNWSDDRTSAHAAYSVVYASCPLTCPLRLEEMEA